MPTLIIKRNKWIRGRFYFPSLMGGNNFCAIGFARESVGLPRRITGGLSAHYDISPVAGRADSPDEVAAHLSGTGLEWLVCPERNDPSDGKRITGFRYSRVACEIMRANDNVSYDSAWREWRLTKIFARHGVELKFEGKPTLLSRIFERVRVWKSRKSSTQP